MRYCPYGSGFRHAACGLLLYGRLASNGELAQKEEWFVLQSVEAPNGKNTRKASPLIVVDAGGSGYDLIGFSTEDSEFSYVWIITNPKTDDLRVKMMPRNVKFKMKCTVIEGIEDAILVDPAVDHFLRESRILP
jgi:hypothetical protein